MASAWKRLTSAPLLRQTLLRLRQRYPHADPPSLVVSFLLLHEMTAILPVGLAFWGLKAAGAGDKLVGWVDDGEWRDEAVRKAEWVGRRFGAMGFEKEGRAERESRKAREKEQGMVHLVEGKGESEIVSKRLGGDVANLVVAYVAVKALLPLRILASIRLAPPLANIISKRFKGLRDLGARYIKKKDI